jgi:hypothetical protein
MIAAETGVVIEAAIEAAIVVADVAGAGVVVAVAADPVVLLRNRVMAADGICLPPNMLRPRAIAIPAASIIVAARMIAAPNVVAQSVALTEFQLSTVDMTAALPFRRKKERTTLFFPANRSQNIARGPCLRPLSR